MIDEDLAERAFCAARRAYPAEDGALDHPQEILRTEAIGYVDGSSVLYSGDIVFWVARNHDIAPGSGYDRWLFR